MSLEQAPTRAVLLSLREEREVVGEAYNFLDEKRLLLAAEIIQQLKEYENLREKLEAQTRKARQQLVAATARHGLQGLSVYPALALKSVELQSHQRNFMGVQLRERSLEAEPGTININDICRPTAEAEACRQLFHEITLTSTKLAGLSGNLYRLVREYRLTQRRARALENVIIPELEGQLRDTSVYLEEMDMEDVIRARGGR